MKQQPRRVEEVARITNAPISRREDIAFRQKRYLISMGIRTVCFVGAVIVTLAHAPRWAMWVLIFGAVFLPYVAVVMANSSPPLMKDDDVEGPNLVHRELPHRP